MQRSVTIEQVKEDPSKMDLFLRENTGIVHYVLHKFDFFPDMRDELEQVAMVALYEAVGRFDTKKGVKFITYATKCVYSKVASAIETYYDITYLPRWIVQAQQELNDGKDIAALAKKYRSLLTSFRNAISLKQVMWWDDKIQDDEDSGSLQDITATPEPTPEDIVLDQIYTEQLHQLITETINSFPTLRHREWLKMYMRGMRPLEVATIYGMSRQDVSKINCIFRDKFRKRLATFEKYRYRTKS